MIELLAWCHHSFFFGGNLCSILLLNGNYLWGLGSSWVATPVGEWHAAMCPGLRFCSAKPWILWSCLPMRSTAEMSQWRAGLGSSWVAHVLFSESTALEFHTMHFLYRNFDLRPFAATCYGTRQLNVDSFGVQAMDHVVVWCFWLLPCLRAPGRGGAWVPGGLRPGFLLLLLIHDPDIAFLIMHRYVSQVSLAKRASPQLENRVQIFTSHLPMMD